MPCWTVKTTNVNMGTMNLALLQAGLEAAGYTVKLEGERLIFSKDGSYRFHEYQAGQLSVSGENVEQLSNEVRRAYSAEIVRSQMSRAGWKMTKTATGFVANKRG